MSKRVHESNINIFDDLELEPEASQQIPETHIDTQYEEISDPADIVLSREQYNAVLADIERRDTINSYYRYVLKCRPDLKETKLHKVLADRIQEFLERPGRKDGSSFLLISLPFQTGKTTWGAQSIPSWAMQRFPGTNYIIISYSSAFAAKASAENKRKIEWNLDLWPGAKIGNKWTNDEFEVIFDAKKNIKSTCLSATMSTVNGNPADVLIIDDTCHDSTEANSDTFNNTLEDNWLSVVRSRIRVGGKVILMQTRWNMRDIFEVIKGLEDPSAIEVLNIPCECIDAENDPLGRQLGDGPCPEIGKGRTWVQKFKEAYIRKGSMLTWENNYQGNPTISEGNLFKDKMFRSCEFGKPTVKGLVRSDGSTVIWPCVALSVDAALKDGEKNDFNALQIWAKLEDDYFLLWAEKGHYSFPQLLERINQLDRIYKINYRYIEAAANGVAAVQMLRVAGVKNVIDVQPEGGKYSRAMAVTWLFHSGHVYVDKTAEWYPEWSKSLKEFPNGRHDDDVDATSQALNRMTMLAAHESAEKQVIGKQLVWTEDMIEDYNAANSAERLMLMELWGEPPKALHNGLDLMGV
ncbi:MAG: phage terminase large subunit [Clostridia bacterium]|nr:phage terminase large subunit [Clostridia bacterium]